MDNKYYNWFAGTHCFPKCFPKKVRECQEKIENLFKTSPISSRREFIELVRKKNKICTLSVCEYARFVYGEPYCFCKHNKSIDEKGVKRREILKELTILLIWLTRFSEDKGLESEKVWRAWKGYDWDILDELLKEEKISFSYKSKSVLLRDKGIEEAKKLINKFRL